MRPPFPGTERFDGSRHDGSQFACGNAVLDRWLVRYAGQSDRRDIARTFVVTREAGVVIGYYAVVAGELEHEAATESTRKGLPRHFPIPVAILARLAVDHRQQGLGLGAALLNDSLRRVLLAAEQVAIRAVVVHAVDEQAARYYERFGFRALSASPRALMVTVIELRAAGYS